MGFRFGEGQKVMRWTEMSLYVFLLLSCSSSLSWCYKEGGKGRAGGRVGGLRGGGERLGEMSNGIGEPTCEELRAMWRYHKRQSRAELTNAIPTFDQIYWQLPPHSSSSLNFNPHGQQYPNQGRMSGFGPGGKSLKNFKLNSRSRSRASRHGLYGQINYGGGPGGGAPRQLRPMEKVWKEVAQAKSPAGNNNNNAPASTITQPVLHLSPPPKNPAASPSSFQQIQQLLRQESNGGGGGGGDGAEDSSSSSSRKGSASQFGTLVLSPPEGQDGRVANKNPALMTPFEKLRFGHVRLSDEGEESDGRGGLLREISKRGLFYYPIRSTRMREPRTTTTAAPPPPPPPPSSYRLPHLQSSMSQGGFSSASSFSPLPPDQQQQQQQQQYNSNIRQQFQPPPIPSVFSFWRRQNQEPPLHQPPQTRMVDSISSCSLVQGSPCSLNAHCACSGQGLYRCHQGICHFLHLLNSVTDLEESGSWHDDPFDSESELGLWEEGGGGGGGGGGGVGEEEEETQDLLEQVHGGRDQDQVVDEGEDEEVDDDDDDEDGEENPFISSIHNFHVNLI